MSGEAMVLLDWLVITVGALSACIGLYLRFLIPQRLPLLYTFGFYGAGLAIMSISFVPVFVPYPWFRIASLYGALLVLIMIEVAVLNHIYRKYGVCWPGFPALLGKHPDH